MRSGFKVAAAGLAVVLGCSILALSPFEWPFPSDANPLTATANDTAFKDGVYRATGPGKFGPVGVKVVIEDGAITDIAVTSSSESSLMGQMAQDTVVPQIIETQGVDNIDVATGATETSEAIISAVASVLDRARP